MSFFKVRRTIVTWVRFAALFKQVTAFEAKRKMGGRLWQAHFYDHIVRQEEPIEPVAWYIWQNPVRRGLCSAPHRYPYSGSETMDWKKASIVAEAWIPPWKTQKLAP
jgi:hypothetical protein